jgi:GGDEF domain-containing protein
MQQGPPRRRRARPVADAPTDALLLRVEDLTKGWLLALLEQAPLDDAPAILGAGLARDGPRVCAAVIRALADDVDLRRMEPGGSLELLVSRTGEFAGARSVEATSRAVDMLGSVIWSGLRSELADPDPNQVSELAERLALVIELVRGAVLRRCAGQIPVPFASGDAVRSASRVGEDVLSLRVEDVPPPGAAAPATPTDALWIGALDDEVRRSEGSSTPLSLLLIELEDADRVLAVETSGEATATFGRFAQAVRSVVRRQDILACETDTRAWIIARDTGRLGAHALGSRIGSAVRAAQPWRGAPMAISVGLSVLGEDGRDSASLIEAAEGARFAAAASGRDIAGEPRSEPPGTAGPELVD